MNKLQINQQDYPPDSKAAQGFKTKKPATRLGEKNQMYSLLRAAAPVSASTGYLIFVVSLLVLAVVLRFFTRSNKI